MKKLMKCAEGYIKQMGLLDMAFIKFCLLALGVLLGVAVPKRLKDYVAIVASSIFTGSYVICMTRFLRFMLSCKKQPQEEAQVVTLKL